MLRARPTPPPDGDSRDVGVFVGPRSGKAYPRLADWRRSLTTGCAPSGLARSSAPTALSVAGEVAFILRPVLHAFLIACYRGGQSSRSGQSRYVDGDRVFMYMEKEKEKKKKKKKKKHAHQFPPPSFGSTNPGSFSNSNKSSHFQINKNNPPSPPPTKNQASCVDPLDRVAHD
jgi:hypothetical protein